MMHVDKWLDDLKKLIDEIEDKKFEIEQWGSVAEGTGGRANGERVQSTSTGDALEKAAIEKLFTVDELNVLKARLAKRIEIIKRLTADEYALIYKVYVQDFTIKQFARMRHRGSTWASEKHKAAKIHLQSILNKEYGGVKNG